MNKCTVCDRLWTSPMSKWTRCSWCGSESHLSNVIKLPEHSGNTGKVIDMRTRKLLNGSADKPKKEQI